MKLAVTQPNYLPWIGYFDLLDEVDVWVCLDNVQLVRRSFHVRNRIKGPDSTERWLTVNLAKTPRNTLICQAFLAETPWWRDHLNKIRAYYRDAQSYAELDEFIEDLITVHTEDKVLSRHNRRIIEDICTVLAIQVEIVSASDLVPLLAGSAQEKILRICDELRPSRYYNFKGGVEAELYNPADFAKLGIQFVTQDYRHPVYRQLGNGFLPYLSVIDLMLNEGDRTLEIIRSGRHWIESA